MGSMLAKTDKCAKSHHLLFLFRLLLHRGKALPLLCCFLFAHDQHHVSFYLERKESELLVIRKLSKNRDNINKYNVITDSFQHVFSFDLEFNFCIILTEIQI